MIESSTPGEALDALCNLLVTNRLAVSFLSPAGKRAHDEGERQLRAIQNRFAVDRETEIRQIETLKAARQEAEHLRLAAQEAEAERSKAARQLAELQVRAGRPPPLPWDKATECGHYLHDWTHLTKWPSF